MLNYFFRIEDFEDSAQTWSQIQFSQNLKVLSHWDNVVSIFQSQLQLAKYYY